MADNTPPAPSLHERIATFIDYHKYQSGFDTNCTCGIPGIWTWDDYRIHLSDVLITELGFTTTDVEPYHGKTSGQP